MKNPFKKLTPREEVERDIAADAAEKAQLLAAYRDGTAPADAEDRLMRIAVRVETNAYRLEKALDDERIAADAEAAAQRQKDIDDAEKLKRSKFDAIGAHTRRRAKAVSEMETAVEAVMAPFGIVVDATDKILNLLPEPICHRIAVDGEELRYLMRGEEVLKRVLIRAANKLGLVSNLPFKVSDPDAIGPVSATEKQVAREVVNLGRQQLIDPPPLPEQPSPPPFKPAYSEVIPEFGSPPPAGGRALPGSAGCRG